MGWISRVGAVASGCVVLALAGCASLLCVPTHPGGEAFADGATGALGSGLADNELIEKCQQAVLDAGEPYRVVQVTVWSDGPARSSPDGMIAPLVVKSVYLRQHGRETRTAHVQCRLNHAGEVVALL
jgi:hypothetical protein